MEKFRRIMISIIIAAMLVTGFAPATMQAQAAEKVKLNTTEVTLTVGATKQLKVTGTKKTVTWSSNKKSVATVSKKGKVTAKKAGTATITAKVGKKKLTCKVTVSKLKVVKISKGKSANVKMQPSEKIRLTLTTSQKIIWTSSDKKVATVDKNGIVTAKEPGFVRIKAKYGKDWILCPIEVKLDDQIQITQSSITLYSEEISSSDPAWNAKYDNGQDEMKLTAVYASGNKCRNKYLCWYTEEDDDCVRVSGDGTVSACGYGTTRVWVLDILSDTKAYCDVTVVSKVEEDLNNRAEQILSGIITDDMSDAEKVLAVHDWICLNMKYDYVTTVPGAYSGLIDGKGQCGEYADTFKYLMEKLNIPCVVVASAKMNHGWNQVCLNGKWYWLDVGWDDTDDESGRCPIRYKYFLNVGYRQTDERVWDKEKGIYYDYAWDYNPKEIAYKYTLKYNPHVDGIILPE